MKRFGKGQTAKDQVVLWRAAARGHEAMGRKSEAIACWNTARLILGLPSRKARA